MMAHGDGGGVHGEVAANDAVTTTCNRQISGGAADAAEEDSTDTCSTGTGTGTYRDFSHVAMSDNGRKTFPSAGGVASSSKTRDPSFPAKLHMILSDPDFEGIVSWLPHGRSWKVVRTDLFEEIVLPRFFCHCKVASFMRQVNGWGFRRVRQGPDFNSYYHEYFLRGLPQLCGRMRRESVRSLKARGKKTAGASSREGGEDEAVPDFHKISEEHPLPENPKSKPMEANLGTAASCLGGSGDMLTSSAQHMARSFATASMPMKQHRMTLLDRLDAQRNAVAKQEASRAFASASVSASRSSLHTHGTVVEPSIMHHEAPTSSSATAVLTNPMGLTALLRQAQRQQPTPREALSSSLASFAVAAARSTFSAGQGLPSSVGGNPFGLSSHCGGGVVPNAGFRDILGSGGGGQAPSPAIDGSMLRTVPQAQATVADAILQQHGISSLLSSRPLNDGAGPVASLLSSRSLDQRREDSALRQGADSLASLFSSQLRQDNILPRSGAGTVASLLSSRSGSYPSDQGGLLDRHGLGRR